MRNRLHRLLVELDRAPNATVADLAARLGTTPASTRRDLEDLRAAGIEQAANALARM